MSEFKDSFIGTYEHSLDPKNRLFIPAAFRGLLGENFVLYRVPKEKCLFLYSREEWSHVIAPLMTDGPTPIEERRKQRKVFAYATDATLDAKGRITIPQKFCDHAELEKDVVLMGNGRRVEVWNTKLWDEEFGICEESDVSDLNY